MDANERLLIVNKETGERIARNPTDIDIEFNTVNGVDPGQTATDLTAHLNGEASKHDATEIDLELADGSKHNIQAASDDVEKAITDLDDAIGALDATPDNYTPSSPGIVASHLEAIDGVLLNISNTRTFTNVQGAQITIRQVVRVTAAGLVLADADDSANGVGAAYGFVADATIADDAEGKVYITPGCVIGGFSTLT